MGDGLPLIAGENQVVHLGVEINGDHAAFDCRPADYQAAPHERAEAAAKWGALFESNHDLIEIAACDEFRLDNNEQPP